LLPRPGRLAVDLGCGEGRLLRELAAMGQDRDLQIGETAWISLVIRDDQPIPVRGSTTLQAGDEILALTDPERGPDLTATFTARPESGAAGPARA
jgi:NhaP-type Na+/H+ and K+/H+ antiporter